MLDPVPLVVFWVIMAGVGFMLGRMESKINRLEEKNKEEPLNETKSK